MRDVIMHPSQRCAAPAASPSPAAPQDLLGNCVAAAGSLVFLGDQDGAMMSWDVTTGKCHAVTTGESYLRDEGQGVCPFCAVAVVPPRPRERGVHAAGTSVACP